MMVNLPLKKVGNVGKRHVNKELTDEFIKPFYENFKMDKLSFNYNAGWFYVSII